MRALRALAAASCPACAYAWSQRLVSLVIAALILVFSFGAPVVSMLSGYDYATGDLRAKLLAPGEQGHLLGTDANGRDILTRLAYGGRVSMMVSVGASSSIGPSSGE